MVQVRMALNPLDSLRYSLKKSSSKAHLLRLVIGDGLKELNACFGVEPDFHLRSLLVASFRTLSPGISFTVPSSI
jgi:hypothetical protein